MTVGANANNATKDLCCMHGYSKRLYNESPDIKFVTPHNIARPCTFYDTGLIAHTTVCIYSATLHRCTIVCLQHGGWMTSLSPHVITCNASKSEEWQLQRKEDVCTTIDTINLILILTVTVQLNNMQYSKHSTKYRHMSYVSREINTRQCYCTVPTTFRCYCRSA